VQAVSKYDKERLPDAHGLVDIESSFSKLVGNKFKAVFDLKFLKIVVHVVFGKLSTRWNNTVLCLQAHANGTCDTQKLQCRITQGPYMHLQGLMALATAMNNIHALTAMLMVTVNAHDHLMMQQIHVCVRAGGLMHKLLPFVRKRKPAMVRLGSDMRYSEIIREVNRDAATVAALVLAAIAFVCLKVARVL